MGQWNSCVAKAQLDPAPTGHIIAPWQWGHSEINVQRWRRSHTAPTAQNLKSTIWRCCISENDPKRRNLNNLFIHGMPSRNTCSPHWKKKRVENNLKNDCCSYLLKNYNNMITFLFLVMAGTHWMVPQGTGVGALYGKGKARSNHAGFSHSCCPDSSRTQPCFNTTQEPHTSLWLLFSPYSWSLPF